MNLPIHSFIGQTAVLLANGSSKPTNSPVADPVSVSGSTLTTTFYHPFYDITQASFTEADHLHTGDRLQTTDGGTATITGLRLYHQTTTTYDLTIAGLHTYYVLAGPTPLLVHNCGGGRIQSLTPSGVRLSQSSVNGAAKIIQSMRVDGWVGDPIDVVRMPDGGLTTIDNTRVVAANQAGINVQAVLHEFDEALPEEFVGRFTTPKGGAPSTWGRLDRKLTWLTY